LKNNFVLKCAKFCRKDEMTGRWEVQPKSGPWWGPEQGYVDIACGNAGLQALLRGELFEQIGKAISEMRVGFFY
jgi:hypothetical protein